MTHGIDTDFLVASEILEHPFHRAADALIRRLLKEGHNFAVAPQTLAEFIHIVSDARRMRQPLSVVDATTRAETWWNAAEVVRVQPDGQSVPNFFNWIQEHRLGRKRLLDTMLASTFLHAGILKLVTNNKKDYEVFGCFEIVTYRG